MTSQSSGGKTAVIRFHASRIVDPADVDLSPFMREIFAQLFTDEFDRSTEIDR
jgi:hypothetical protein